MFCNRFVLGKRRQDEFDKRFKAAPVPSHLVNRSKLPMKQTGGLTAYDIQVLFTSHAKFLFHGMFPDVHCYKVICRMSDLFRRLLCNTVTMTELDKLQLLVAEVMSEYEAAFPVTEHAAVPHTILHLVRHMWYYGPLKEYSMYCFERFMQYIKKFSLNTAQAEATIIRRYLTLNRSRFLPVDQKNRLMNRYS
jgi:hypothetical protein